MAKSKVSDNARTQAMLLRSEGASYKDIVAALSNEGVTDNWCKKNLGTVAVFDTHFFLMEQLTPLAIRPEGISRMEFRTKIKLAYGIPFDVAIPGAIDKRTRRALPEDAFIRPDWMEPEAARASQNEIIQDATILFDRLDEMVAEFCYRHPAASPWHVRQEIVTLAIGGHPAGPMIQGRRMLDAVDRMEGRMTQKTVDKLTVLADEEFDHLCI